MVENILEIINNTISTSNNYIVLLTKIELDTDSSPSIREISDLTDLLRENTNSSCIEHYKDTLSFFHKCYTNDLLNCERLRYLQLIESEVSTNSSTILENVRLLVAEVQNHLDDNNLNEVLIKMIIFVILY